MTEAEKIQRALQAQGALDIMADKFRTLGDAYNRQIVTATSADSAWQGVLKYQALMDVIRSLKSDIDTAKFDQKAKELNNDN